MDLYIYGPILSIVRASCEVLDVAGTGPYTTYGLFFLSIAGLVILGLIPNKNTGLQLTRPSHHQCDLRHCRYSGPQLTYPTTRDL